MKIRLANPENRLPWPGVNGRFLTGTTVEDIDPYHPFWAACLRDGSVVAAPETDIKTAPALGKISKE